MPAEKAYWLALVYASNVKLSVVKAVAQQWYLMEGKALVELFNLSAAEMGVHFDIAESDAAKILKSADAHARYLTQLSEWEGRGIQLLPLSHPHYPSRLLTNLPPLQQPLFLWAQGNTEIINQASVTILGNPEPSTEIIAEVDTLVTNLVQEDVGLVSGYGKGLDRIAFESALKQEKGRGVAILPMGLTAFAKYATKLSPAIQAGKAVLLSPFPPDTAFKESFASARNLLVDSLATVLLVPHADELAQTRAKSALEQGLPVLVGRTDTPANRALIDAGAFLMTDIQEVVELVQQAILDHEIQRDAALKDKAAQKTDKKPAPPIELLNDIDNYKLHTEPLEALEADKAIEILSAGGNIPTSLRKRLMALEKENQAKEK